MFRVLTTSGTGSRAHRERGLLGPEPQQRPLGGELRRGRRRERPARVVLQQAPELRCPDPRHHRLPYPLGREDPVHEEVRELRGHLPLPLQEAPLQDERPHLGGLHGLENALQGEPGEDRGQGKQPRQGARALIAGQRAALQASLIDERDSQLCSAPVGDVANDGAARRQRPGRVVVHPDDHLDEAQQEPEPAGRRPGAAPPPRAK